MRCNCWSRIKESDIFIDRNCSIETKANTFFQTNTSWIEKTDIYEAVKDGFHLSPVYQLQPYDLALKEASMLELSIVKI